MKKSKTYNADPLEITAELENIGINRKEIPKVDMMKIKDSEEAYKLLLNSYKTSSRECERLNSENKKLKDIITELKDEITELKLVDRDKKHAVVILTFAEILTSVGIGGIFTSYLIMSLFMIFCGLSLTMYSLYLNFKK